jgi:hypothetical protein
MKGRQGSAELRDPRPVPEAVPEQTDEGTDEGRVEGVDMGITGERTEVRRSSALAGGGVAVLAVLALAGCGSSSSGSGGGPPSGAGAGTSATAGGSSGSNGGTDTAVRTAMTTTSKAGSAKLTMEETVKTAGKSLTLDGKGTTTLTGSGSGAASGAKGQFTMAAGGQTIQMRQIGTTLYEQIPPGAARQKLSAGKPWIKIDTTKVAASVGDTDQAPDAGAQLAYLQHAKQATKVGTENVDGASTTHYRTTVAPSALNSSGVKATKPMAIDIWVDAQHRVRLEKATLDFTATGNSPSANSATSGGGSSTAQSGSVEVVMHLTDFGTQVKVTAPPSDQVTDATRKIASAANGSTAAG